MPRDRNILRIPSYSKDLIANSCIFFPVYITEILVKLFKEKPLFHHIALPGPDRVTYPRGIAISPLQGYF